MDAFLIVLFFYLFWWVVLGMVVLDLHIYIYKHKRVRVYLYLLAMVIAISICGWRFWPKPPWPPYLYHVTISGQDHYAAGNEVALIMGVEKCSSVGKNFAIAGARVELAIIENRRRRVVFVGTTDERGELDAKFSAARNWLGKYIIEIAVDSAYGTERICRADSFCSPA